MVVTPEMADSVNVLILVLIGLVGFFDISTIVDYLMSNHAT